MQADGAYSWLQASGSGNGLFTSYYCKLLAERYPLDRAGQLCLGVMFGLVVARLTIFEPT